MGRRALGVVSTVIAVAVSVLSSFYVFGSDGYRPSDQTLHPTWLSGLSFLAAIGAAVMLCWRHRWPVLVAGIALVPSLLLTADSMAALIALAALAANRRDRVLWAGTAAVFAATALAVWRDANRDPSVTVAGRFVGAESTAGQIIGVLLMTAVLTAIPLTVGITRGVRADLGRRELKERELRAEVTRQDERSRIAREMHDVLGHRLSLLSLQAGALEVNQGSTAEVAKTVRTTARQSLQDLRQVIGVLRDGRDFTGREDDSAGPGSESGARAQPNMADLPELIASSRQAGLPANITVLIDQPGSAPPALGTAAYRIVQESLTNVLRHAPGSAAEVTVRGGPGVGVAIEVVNPLAAMAPSEPSPGSGTGLTGVSERVAMLGGNVSAGPIDGRVFALRAWLPWPMPPVPPLP
ncbi:sensor histidine kinase [Amycolatopsis nigrescens]|uniref:sensor histidine kinase n=1 Tax=Amycolatopsis nigrescens TaxID=381445 RepID=UPI000370C0AA|nr:histidine kinase [Amycolatopsis nigrescens]